MSANTKHKIPLPHTLVLPWYDHNGDKQRTIMTMDGVPGDYVSTRVATSAVARFYFRSLGIEVNRAEVRELVLRGYNGYIKRKSEVMNEEANTESDTTG